MRAVFFKFSLLTLTNAKPEYQFISNSILLVSLSKFLDEWYPKKL
jgi:hypothetical protein